MIYDLRFTRRRLLGGVAQSCTLLYRRVALGRTLEVSERFGLVNVLQNAILRYSRVQLCATSQAATHNRSSGPACAFSRQGFLWLATVLTALLIQAAPLPAQTTAQLSAEFWNNPTFVRQFLGSYGVRSEIEPKISPDEQKLFQSLIPQIKADPAAAAATLQKAIQPESSAALDFTLGNLQFQSGKLEAAAQNYRKALEKFPDFLRAHKNLALVLVQHGEFNSAVGSFTRTLELGGEDGNVYGLLGYCYLNLDKQISAESAYRKALMFAPDNADWKLGVARSLLSQERQREAVALFEELIQADPHNADYWLFQANGWIGLQEPLKAAANFEVVRRMGQATADTLLTLGDIYLNHDLPELGAATYQVALKAEPPAKFERLLKGLEVLARRGDHQPARELLDSLRRARSGELTEAHRLALLRVESRLALAAGDAGAAVRVLEELLERDPMDGAALLLLAGYRSRSGEVEKAALLYERAARIKSHEPDALVQHAQMLVGADQYEKAVLLLRRAQQTQPRENVARYLEQVERLSRATTPTRTP